MRALVTGAAQGLGAAIARHLAERGAELVLMDRDAAGMTAIPGAEAIAVDLADGAALEAALGDVGPVDALIHNAAILRSEPLTDVSLASFRETMAVGVEAGFLLSRAVWPGMVAAGGGTLVFVSSQSGVRGFACETSYCAAKHALEGLSKCLALEGAAHGIVSCTVTPGHAMRTPMSERNYPPELKATWIDPARLAPAFAAVVERRDPAWSGKRLNAWEMVREAAA